MLLHFEKRAIRDLKKLPKQLRIAILDTLHDLSLLDYPLRDKNVKKIKNSPSNWYRLRYKQYRIIFDADGNILSIMHVRKRNENTYKNI